MPILIRNDSPPGALNEAKIENRLKKILSASGCDEGAEVSVWICDDEAIRALHREYFDDDTPTNVISFSQREGDFAEVEPELLGDVVISFDTARRDAEAAGKSLDDEVTYLFIHGLLHLLGFDHEGENAHRAPEMEAREETLYRELLASEESA